MAARGYPGKKENGVIYDTWSKADAYRPSYRRIRLYLRSLGLPYAADLSIWVDHLTSIGLLVELCRLHLRSTC